MEFFERMSKAFVELPIWMESTTNSLFPRPDLASDAQAQEHFKTLGSFIALAIMDKRLVNLPFNPLMLDSFLGRSSDYSLDRLAMITPDLVQSVKTLLTCGNAAAFEGLEYAVPG